MNHKNSMSYAILMIAINWTDYNHRGWYGGMRPNQLAHSMATTGGPCSQPEIDNKRPFTQ